MDFLFLTYEYDNKIRLGNQGDGGYIIADLPGSYDCYLSCGVNDEESFTRDFLELGKVPDGKSFAFDGTIQSYPYQYSKDIFFMKKNIGSENSTEKTNLSSILSQHKDVFIKMDIEGGEYEWLNSDVDLSNIKQLVIEFHGICDDNWGHKKSEKNLAMRKLLKTHTLVHCHANNYGTIYLANYYGDSLPTVIECTFIKNSEIEFPKFNTQKFPLIGIDYKNRWDRDEIDLKSYPFVKIDKISHNIPKKIIQTYRYDFENLDDVIKYNIEIMRKINPEYVYTYFSDEDCNRWIKENCDDEIFKIYNSIKIPVSKADLFRYLYIYQEGGIYLDIKSSIVYPIDYILQHKSETILSHWISTPYREKLNYELGEFQNWFLIYPKNHPIIKETIDRVIYNLKNYKFDHTKSIKSQIVETTGPLPYSQSIINYINENGKNNIIEHKSSGVDGWPSGLLYSIYYLFGENHEEKIKSYENIIPII
jgi:mannosyltransferase OCH1-like enzyme